LITGVATCVPLQASIAQPSVAEQLKDMVSAMQEELGDAEVEVNRVIGQGSYGIVYQVRRGTTHTPCRHYTGTK
jgi:hypothetical protein